VSRSAVPHAEDIGAAFLGPSSVAGLKTYTCFAGYGTAVMAFVGNER
jgi:hypothetical protein